MKQERSYKVFKIMDGVVVDHIPRYKSIKVVNVLGLNRHLGEGMMTLGMNLDSEKMGKKDILKIENKELTKEELNKIALISPKASVNIIQDGEVIEKLKINIPNLFSNLIKCPNPKCITNVNDVNSKFITKSKDPLMIQCHYCEKIFEREDVNLI